MRVYLSAIAAVVGAAVAVSAAAQVISAPNAPPRPDMRELRGARDNPQQGKAPVSPETIARLDREAYAEYLQYSDCAAGIGARYVQSLLEEVPGTSGEAVKAQQMFARFRGCKIKAGDVQTRLLRGAFAEALLRREERAEARPSLPVAEHLPTDFLASRPVTANEVQRGYDMLQQRSLCVAAMAPTQTKALLSTTLGSSDEQTALAAAYSAAPRCGKPDPQSASQTVMRAFLAEGAFQWTQWNKNVRDKAS